MKLYDIAWPSWYTEYTNWYRWGWDEKNRRRKKNWWWENQTMLQENNGKNLKDKAKFVSPSQYYVHG